MRLLAPAKINLHLRVAPPRSDKFHPLLSWMCTVGLFDSLTLERSSRPGISLTCDRSDLPCDQSNLVVKVATALAQTLAQERQGTGQEPAGVTASLQKQIPMGAGLGGGSSDGAHALLGLASLWEVSWDREKLASFAARFGSDLSFFFYSPSAVCAGRGELVRPIDRPKVSWAVLILPPEALPTPAVYRRFDELKLGDPQAVSHEPDWQRWTQLSAEALLPLLINDLEPAAFSLMPRLGRLRAEVEQAVGRIVRMSGSGSSLFTLFDEPAAARQAAQAIVDGLGVRALAVELGSSLNNPLNAAPPER